AAGLDDGLAGWMDSWLTPDPGPSDVALGHRCCQGEPPASLIYIALRQAKECCKGMCVCGVCAGGARVSLPLKLKSPAHCLRRNCLGDCERAETHTHTHTHTNTLG